MLRLMCKSKIHRATVTEACIDYEGSITIDEDIIKAVGILPGEKVEVFNVNNGARLETYVIAGKAGAGQICLNGPAARQGFPGDKLILVSYCLVTPEEARGMKTVTVRLDDANRIKT